MASARCPPQPVADEDLPLELRGAKILASSSNCWLVYEKKNDFSFEKQEFSLWKNRTSDLINLPPLPGKKLHKFFLCSITSPPDIHDSMVILLDWNRPKSILRWKFGDEFWTKHQIKDDTSLDFLEKCPWEDTLLAHVTFEDGRFFGLSRFDQNLYMINTLNSTTDSVSLVLVSNSVPMNQKKTDFMSFRYMLESCGDLYLVYLVPGGFKWKEVVAVEVYKFDFSVMEWSRVKNLGDRVFFVSGRCSFSFSASSVFKSNHVYFIPPVHRNICTFNMDDQTISVCPPLEDLLTQEDFTTPGADDHYSNLQQPWLMYCKKGESVCNLISPICQGEKYMMDIPNNQSSDVTATSCSREGWCLMFQGEDSVFLWNPFAKETIHLPKLSRTCGVINGCSVSPSLDWIVLVCDGCFIESFVLREGEWQSRTLFYKGDLKLDDVLTFCNGTFYSLLKSSSVKLVSFTETKEGFSFRIHDELEMPYANYHQVFLLEMNKKLVSVFVDFLGQWVRIFQLDDTDMVWVEVEDLGNHTIYVSSGSSFSITASPGMENRVYFSRYHAKETDFVYYSLESKKLHTHSTKLDLDNFYNTEEQLHSIWIVPKSF